jgi:hypothetical protein
VLIRLVLVLVGVLVVAAAVWAEEGSTWRRPETRRMWARRIRLGVGAAAVAGVISVSA